MPAVPCNPNDRCCRSLHFVSDQALAAAGIDCPKRPVPIFFQGEINMINLSDAINAVLDWDISDDLLSDALAAEICLLARIGSDDVAGFHLD